MVGTKNEVQVVEWDGYEKILSAVDADIAWRYCRKTALEACSVLLIICKQAEHNGYLRKTPDRLVKNG